MKIEIILSFFVTVMYRDIEGKHWCYDLCDKMMMITVAVMELLVDSFVRENIENWQNFYLEPTMMIIVVIIIVIIIVIILMYSFVDEKIENCENDNGY